MRVLLIAGSFPPEPCGVGDYTYKLAEVLASQPNMKIAVICKKDTEYQFLSTIDIIAKVNAWSFSEIFKIVISIKNWRPDLIHIQYPCQGFFGYRFPVLMPIIFRILRIPVVQTWHEPPPKGGRALLYFLLPLFGAAGLIFVRANYVNYFSARLQKLINRYPMITVKNTSALPMSRLTNNQRLDLRKKMILGKSRLIAFFGFISRRKGIEQIFDVANVETDHLVIVGQASDSLYLEELNDIAVSKGWSGHISFTGFVEAERAANILAASDSVILPFLDGGGDWNTSIHSAVAQGTFVLTTGMSELGMYPDENLYMANISNLDEMRTALDKFSGRRITPGLHSRDWTSVGNVHLSFYKKIISIY